MADKIQLVTADQGEKMVEALETLAENVQYLKGDNGADGTAADIDSITVTVDNTSSSSPKCTVTKGGTSTNRTFTFAFTGLKGANGASGSGGGGTYGNFASSEWSEIRAASDEGVAESIWSVGDMKAVQVEGRIGNYLEISDTFYAVIIGFNHNSQYEGANRIHMTLADGRGNPICLIDNENWSNYEDGQKMFNINHWGDVNYGGWRSCNLRYDILGSTDVPPNDYGDYKYNDYAVADDGGIIPKSMGYNASETCATSPVPNTLMAALPEDLRAVMKPVGKYTDNAGFGYGYYESQVTQTTDYLPLLSEKEVFGYINCSNEYEDGYQEQYEFYVNGNSARRYNQSGSYADYWLRSPYYGDGSYWCCVYSDGDNDGENVGCSLGLAVAFFV